MKKDDVAEEALSSFVCRCEEKNGNPSPGIVRAPVIVKALVNYIYFFYLRNTFIHKFKLSKFVQCWDEYFLSGRVTSEDPYRGYQSVSGVLHHIGRTCDTYIY